MCVRILDVVPAWLEAVGTAQSLQVAATWIVPCVTTSRQISSAFWTLGA